MAVLGLPIVRAPNGLAMSTEFATTAFGLLAGIGGAVSNLVAGQRLSKIDGDQIPVRSLALPLGITILASAGSAFFLPTDL